MFIVSIFRFKNRCLHVSGGEILQVMLKKKQTKGKINHILKYQWANFKNQQMWVPQHSRAVPRLGCGSVSALSLPIKCCQGLTKHFLFYNSNWGTKISWTCWKCVRRRNGGIWCLNLWITRCWTTSRRSQTAWTTAGFGNTYFRL